MRRRYWDNELEAIDAAAELAGDCPIQVGRGHYEDRDDGPTRKLLSWGVRALITAVHERRGRSSADGRPAAEEGEAGGPAAGVAGDARAAERAGAHRGDDARALLLGDVFAEEATQLHEPGGQSRGRLP